MNSFRLVGCGSNRTWLKTLVILDLVGCVLGAVVFIAFSVVIWAPGLGLNDVFEKEGHSSRTVCSIIFALCAIWCAVNCHFYCVVLRAEKSTCVAHGLWQSWSNFVKGCMLTKVGIAIFGICAVAVCSVSIGLRFGVIQLCVTLLLSLIHDGYLMLLTKNRYQEKVAEEAEAKDKYSQYRNGGV